MPAYTEDYILENWDVDKCVRKWIMLKNQLAMEREIDLETRHAFHPFKDKKSKYKRNPLPFYSDKRDEYEGLSFEEKRKKMWENAPAMNLSNIPAAT